ncbi:MAG: hypothetical protein JKY14_10135, partial [Paraglaciecola sp.]|nr:hypothetical protein [Paraglaciecola sp.]
MAPKPALSKLPIKLAKSGFYRGFSVDVTVVSKIIISALVVWAIGAKVIKISSLSSLTALIALIIASFFIHP